MKTGVANIMLSISFEKTTTEFQSNLPFQTTCSHPETEAHEDVYTEVQSSALQGVESYL